MLIALTICLTFFLHVSDDRSRSTSMMICKKGYNLSEFLTPVKRTLLSVPNCVDMVGRRRKGVIYEENYLGELTKGSRMFESKLQATVLS